MINRNISYLAMTMVAACTPLHEGDYQGEPNLIIEGNMSILSIDQYSPPISTPVWIVAGGEEVGFPDGTSVQVTPPSQFSFFVYDYPDDRQTIALPSGGAIGFMKIYISRKRDGSVDRVGASPRELVVALYYGDDHTATVDDIEEMGIFDEESLDILRGGDIGDLFLAKGICKSGESDKLNIQFDVISDGLILDLALIGDGGVESCVDIEDRL